MKKLLLVLAVMLGASGCYLGPMDAYDNCVVFQDEYGDREVCDQPTRVIDGHLFYWDAQFGIWVSSYGYYQGGVFFYGYHPSWRQYWHRGYYHPRGWYHGGGGHWHGGGGRGGRHGR